MHLCSVHWQLGLVRHRVQICDSFWWQTYPQLICAKLCQSNGTFEDVRTTLSGSFVLSGEAVGYDIYATLNMSGSYEDILMIAMGQDVPN